MQWSECSRRNAEHCEVLVDRGASEGVYLCEDAHLCTRAPDGTRFVYERPRRYFSCTAGVESCSSNRLARVAAVYPHSRFIYQRIACETECSE